MAMVGATGDADPLLPSHTEAAVLGRYSSTAVIL